MDLDGQGGMLLMDGYKWRGTEDGLEKQGIFGATWIHSSPSVSHDLSDVLCSPRICHMTSTIINLY